MKNTAGVCYRLAGLILYEPNEELYFIFRDLPDEYQIDTMGFLKLSDAGLVYAEHTLSISPSSKEESTVAIIYGDKAFLIKREKDAPSYHMGTYILTKSGTEL